MLFTQIIVRGVSVLPKNKKITVNMPEDLIGQIDSLQDGKGRSDFLRNAAMHYIKLKNRLNSYENLKKGYEEMGNINLDIAKEWEAADSVQLAEYEKKLEKK